MDAYERTECRAKGHLDSAQLALKASGGGNPLIEGMSAGNCGGMLMSLLG